MDLRRVLLIAMCVTILFIQKQAFAVLPNIQFTTLLIVLFASVFKFKETIMIIIAYVALDSMVYSFHILYTPPMLMGWLLIPIAYHTLLRQTTSEVKLAFFGFVFGFVYGWMFIPFAMIDQGITKLWPYLLADLPWEVMMALSGFLSILWLYKPLYKVLKTQLDTMQSMQDTRVEPR